MAFQESIQIIAAASEFDKSVVAKWNIKKMVEDAVDGTGAPTDWKNDEEVEQSEDEAINEVEGLRKMAGALREGAGVTADVAQAQILAKEAGLLQ